MHAATFAFEPIVVPKPWGGRRLAEFGKHFPTDGPYGESWEIADVPSEHMTTGVAGRTRVLDGPDAGATLRELIARYGPDLMGSARPTPAGDFPLLVKLLDAHQPLSVQVHPTADYVARHPGAVLKTESWYVVAAEPGAVVFKGLRPGVTRQDLVASAGTPEVIDLLESVPAHPGDTHHLPAGIVHALGAGVLVAEVQTPSDTTFRLYDWRHEYDRPERTLHPAAAADAAVVEARGHGPLEEVGWEGRRRLVVTDDYSIVEHRPPFGSRGLPDDELRIVMMVAGSGVLRWNEGERELSAGDTVLVPAMSAGSVAIDAPGAVFLEVGLV